MTNKELMQMAMNALEYGFRIQERKILIEALRARLSQCERCGEVNPAEIHTCTPKQEPVVIDPDGSIRLLKHPPQRQQRTYTLRKWVGLTDEDIRKLSDDCAGVRDETEFIRAIEAKLKDKNT
jgi:hypothetical protein